MTLSWPVVKDRVASSRLVRWCPESNTYQPADDPVCDRHFEHPALGATEDHRLRLRRMLVCGTCEQAYFTRGDFKDHECFSAY